MLCTLFLSSTPKTYDRAGLEAANAYLKQIKLYPLSAAANPPQSVFVDAKDVVVDATIPYDIRFFESLDRIVQNEPWLTRDKAMIDKLSTIGIEKGKPFAPDANTKTMLETTTKNAQAWLANYYETKYETYYPNEKWLMPASPALLKEAGNGFTSTDIYPVDSRGCAYYFAFSSVKHMGAGQFYLFVSRDKAGQVLDGNKNYTLHVPANVPAHQYWSVTLYDFATHALIRDVSIANRSSLTPGLQTNADGSVDLYMGLANEILIPIIGRSAFIKLT